MTDAMGVAVAMTEGVTDTVERGVTGGAATMQEDEGVAFTLEGGKTAAMEEGIVNDMEAGTTAAVEEGTTGPPLCLPLLLNLPPELLALIACKVPQEGKGALRLTCHTTRMTVDEGTTRLSWRGDPGTQEYPSLSALLPVLYRAGRNIKELNCQGMCGALASLAGCPHSVQKLNCGLTLVADLAPLAACTRLQDLTCYATPVVNLGPLAACVGLRRLNCSLTKVVDLGPLAACTALSRLTVNNTGVSDLGPLASCTGLHFFCCMETRVTDVGPLASCTELISITCARTGERTRVPPDQLRLLQRTCPRLILPA